jgi:hypothetical protein
LLLFTKRTTTLLLEGGRLTNLEAPNVYQRVSGTIPFAAADPTSMALQTIDFLA